MKKIIYLSLAAVLLSTGCADWLDASTRSETREEDLFENEEGFKSALTGVYIKLASENLYGANTSFLMLEAIAQHWNINTLDTETPLPALAEFSYTEQRAEKTIKTVWENYYNAVVQLNNILSNLESSRVSFSHHNDQLIKAEALGLRGFIHFDLLRIFGPVPALATGSEKAIPFVDELTKDPAKLISVSWDEVTRRIAEDLDAAEEILGACDPILIYGNNILNDGSNYPETISDRWHLFRQTRLNYWAVKAIKARFYLWLGDTDNAVKYASEVIEESDRLTQDRENAVPDDQFQLATATYLNSSSGTLTLFIENIFGVHNSNHQTVCEKYFTHKNNSSYPLYMPDALIREAYEAEVNPNDIRYANNRYWGRVDGEREDITYFKYTGNGVQRPNNIIPVIRLAEMYLILIECLPIEQARDYFEQYRIARVLNEDLTMQLDEVTRLERVESEYRKEFYGEGQMFHFYKRKNYSVMRWPEVVSVNPSNYVIPKPESQTIFE